MSWVESLMGGGPRQTTALPPDRFHCLLDELPLHLVPRPPRTLMQEPAAGTRLVLNPACRIARGEELPEEFRPFPELLNGFAREGTIAWVRDIEGLPPQPFWLSSETASALEASPPGEELSPNLSERLRTTLCAAGVLIPRDRQPSAEPAIPTREAELFRKKGYAPLRNVIHPFHVAALRRYYRYRIRTGKLCLGDEQSSRRYIDYNEPVARFFHRRIARNLSLLAGRELKPSYVYLASYLSGAELKKHTDRAQCDYSVTFCLDFSPEPELATPWPIRLDAAHGTVTVYQALGDALAYRGTQLPHYRAPLAAGHTSTSIFFHYVPMDFAGSLD